MNKKTKLINQLSKVLYQRFYESGQDNYDNADELNISSRELPDAIRYLNECKSEYAHLTDEEVEQLNSLTKTEWIRLRRKTVRMMKREDATYFSESDIPGAAEEMPDNYREWLNDIT